MTAKDCDYSEYSILSVRAAVHYFDKEAKAWKPADKGISRVEIYKIGPLENEVGSFMYKIVAVSAESHEVVVNTQINSPSFTPEKIKPMFCHWNDESSLIIGLNFASEKEFQDFEKEVDAILSEYHRIAKDIKKSSRKSLRKSMRTSSKISPGQFATKITFTQEDLTKKLNERKNKIKKQEEASATTPTLEGHHHTGHRRKSSISFSKKKDSAKDRKRGDSVDSPK